MNDLDILSWLGALPPAKREQVFRQAKNLSRLTYQTMTDSVLMIYRASMDNMTSRGTIGHVLSR